MQAYMADAPDGEDHRSWSHAGYLQDTIEDTEASYEEPRQSRSVTRDGRFVVAEVDTSKCL